MKIYHNPRCAKSRETLALLRKNKVDPEIVEYLKNPPTAKELRSLLKLLQMPASALVRRSEAIFRDKYKGKNITEEEWVKILAENPKLIQRPIVVSGNKAVLGRPPENVLGLL